MFGTAQTVQVSPVRQNLVIPTDDRYASRLLTKECGFSFYYPYNEKFKGNEELYRNHHYQLSDLLVTKLHTNHEERATNVKVEQILEKVHNNVETEKWFDGAWSLMRQVKRIKENDQKVIYEIIREFGLNPAEFKREFKPHQLQSLALHIVLGYSNNWGQMRTGKTPPAIVYNTALYLKGEIQRCLVVCPASIKWTWYDELAKDLDPMYQTLSHVVEGTKVKRIELLNKPGIFHIINYESLRATIEETHEALQGLSYSMVLDECQYVKNESKRTTAVKSLYDSDNPPYRSVMLSGTPVANTPVDVARPVSMTAPGLLCRNMPDFYERYTQQITAYKVHYLYGALESVQDKMARCSIRALREDCGFDFGLMLDPQILKMGERQNRIYKDIQTLLRAELAGMDGFATTIRVRSFLSQTLKLVQVTDGFLYDDVGNALWLPDKDNAKLKWLDGYIKDYLADIKKLVIFSRFKCVLRKLEERYKQYGAIRVDGDVKKSSIRNDLVNRFRYEDDCQIILMNTIVAMGQDLNPATFAVAYDRMFYLMPNEQADARITGMNQTGESTIMPLVCKDTVDEALVFKVLPEKRKNADAVMGDHGKTTPKISGGITYQDLLTLVG